MTDAIPVTLGRLYEPNMWDVPKQLNAARGKGQPLVFVDLRAPINSEVIGIALRSSDLYLIGIRNRAGAWFEFADDHAERPVPLIPGSRWIAVGPRRARFSYGALGLRVMIDTGKSRYKHRPQDLIRFFSKWDGLIHDDETRLSVCVLMFVISEALRFRSIMRIALIWLSPPAGHPPHFAITRPMWDRVHNWRTMAENPEQDPEFDVDTWPPNMPDRLID